jgi:hypothetical protein
VKKVLATIALGAASLGFLAQPARAGVEATADPEADAAPRRPHTYRVKLTVAGHEYESPQGDVLNDSRTQCPPVVNDPSVPARCWTWRGTHLGHGTFTRDAHYAPPDRFVGTATLTSRDGVLYLATDARVINDPTPDQALGHVNQFQPTWTVVEGTGRFAGITGTLSGTFKTTVVEVDSDTGVIHRKAGGSVSGKLTFPTRLH